MAVVDLMTPIQLALHPPHGMSDAQFADLFTLSKPVIFAFHGWPNAKRLHVRGFNQQGTTTTPFDMVVLSSMSRSVGRRASVIERLP